MNYEELYTELAASGKELKEKLALCTKMYKNLVKETEAGDLKSMDKDLQTLKAACTQMAEAADRLEQKLDGFDRRQYFESGDFEKQLLDVCREKNIDVYGESPVYEMFPYKVRIDAENQDIYLDRKKVSSMRPLSFAAQVAAGQEKLKKASFNADVFALELADAYDTALLRTGKKPGTDIYLQTLYKTMTPMSRSRKEYDPQSFAFDLARLVAAGITETKNGRQFQLGPSRNNAKSVRILDKDGNERFYATACFF